MSQEYEHDRSLILPTLIASISSIDPPGLIISMSLIEVAAAFGVSVGLAGQIRSIGSVLAIAVALSAVMSLTAGVILTCANTLLLVQVPRYRGTVTSLNSAATQLGLALGASLGGVILDASDWGVMGLVYGGMHVAAALIYLVGVRDREEP